VSLSGNLPLLIQALTGPWSDYFYSTHSTHMLVDIRYQLILFPSFLLFLGGLWVCARRGSGSPTRPLVLFALAITAVAPLFSSFFEFPDHLAPSLSDYRMFMLLLPLIAVCAAAFSVALKKWPRWPLAVFALPVVFNLATWAREQAYFRGFVEMYPCGKITSGPRAGDFSCGAHEEVKTREGHGYTLLFNKYGETVVYNEQIAYYKVAHQVLALPRDSGEVLVLDIPVWRPDWQPYIGHFAPYNYHQVFLAAYLGDAGLDTGFIQFFDVRTEAPMPPVRNAIHALWRRWRHREQRHFPAPIDYAHGGYGGTPQGRYGVLRNFTDGRTGALLVTTPEEKRFALEYLKAHGRRYRIAGF
jgi:hypothetical protein